MRLGKKKAMAYKRWHDKETQKKLSHIMSCLDRSERLAVETLHRARTKMNDLRDLALNNNNMQRTCCAYSDESDSTLKEDESINAVALAEKEALLEKKLSSQEEKSTSGEQKAKQISLEEICCQRQSPEESSSLKSPCQNEVLANPMQEMGQPINISKAWDLVSYHMDRISFHCECFITSLPSEEMTKADKLHCQRFHNARCNLCANHHTHSSRSSKISSRSKKTKGKFQ